ncbi:hypothetical protein [Reichenbachiella versicolor]|uniref:hypothetical protein n=1 Tax=Reichenbachiella versicolor TaxID=1821036 RepID=UPI000D6DFE24|nr:hypothetical protein [Reichenbachiella versicolor]
MVKQNKNKATGLYISIGIHLIFALLCVFILAWTEPDPPIPEYGIEFNMGNALPVENASESNTVSETVDKAEELVQDSEQSQSEPNTSTSDAVETIDDNALDEADVIEESVITEDNQSPDIVEDNKVVENSETETVKELEANNEPLPKNENPQNSDATEEKKVDKPKIDNRAIYKKSNSSKTGGNKGASLDISGWMWDFKPNPNDKSSENGKIIFQFTIDDEGEILNVRTIEKTVSPALEKVYRDAVMELTFSPTSDNRSIASQTTGKVTFIIKSN